MLILLYAMNVVNNGYSFAKIPTILQPKVEEQIVLMVGAENQELIDQLLAS